MLDKLHNELIYTKEYFIHSTSEFLKLFFIHGAPNLIILAHRILCQ